MLELEKRSVVYLPGVGPKRGEILKKELGIQSYHDLLYYFPYRYMDRSRFYSVREMDEDMPYIQLKGQIHAFNELGEGRTKRLVATFSDGTGTMDLVWFKGHRFVKDKLKTGVTYIVFGKPALFGSRYNIAHPEVDLVEQSEQISGGLVPYYNTSELMKRCFINSRVIQNMQFALLDWIHGKREEILPEAIKKRVGLIEINEAMQNIHFPQSTDLLKKSQLRLKFDELFFLQLNMLKTAKLRHYKYQGILFPRVGEYFNTFYKTHLPFELTGAQKRVVKEIRTDMGSGRQMNRLLQGDVGSGKTLVGLLSMLLALDNGYQTCMMAPTEILANQHYITLLEFLKGMDVKIALLTGSTKKKQRAALLPALEKGDIQILIGTHALIENSVNFASLGLVIIDEQHRFGVEQRSKLWNKNHLLPHILVMTATPIPRTLAMTLYGDLDVSVIDELPPGRKPIKTLHRYDNRKAELYDFIRKEVKIGRQVYVVYPLIEGNEKLDYKNLEEGFELYQELFPNFKVCMVHGKMKAKDKEAQMQKFSSGEAQILMATTVIEVGVNVPNASVMIIESAERFGLSQLHQLRGRVGRGADQSYCILSSSFKLSAETRKRLEIMVATNDGFQIAEADLKLRGYGDLEGTRQSGEGVDLKIANLATDGQLLQLARDIAGEVLAMDPMLEHPSNRCLQQRLSQLFTKKINWGMIS